jgi:DNA segregation ATPase FtsK/SpoIIIE, S-DNA-T family
VKRKSQKKSSSPVSPVISLEKKKKIIGVFLVLVSFFLFLSIISYSRYDKASLTYVLYDIERAVNPSPNYQINNWMGVIGAHTADFMINSTLGLISLIFPLMLFVYAASLFQKISLRLQLTIINFLLVFGILFSAFFGILISQDYAFTHVYELSGAVGNFLGTVFARLFGGIGSLIIVFAALIILFIIVFDFKVEKIFIALKNLIQTSFAALLDRSSAKEEDYQETVVQKKEKENLTKIKELRPSKKKKTSESETVLETVDQLMSAEEKETKIRIIRKNEPKPEEENAIIEEEHKKTDIKKTDQKEKDEAVQIELDRENEMRLPNQWEEKIDYKRPSFEILESVPEENFKVAEEELKHNAELLKEKLKLFDIDIKDISVTPGPVVTLYEIVPAPGVKISRIVSLEHDIALALAARGIRIIAPIPGKSAIGVEIPNAEASIVKARSVLNKLPEVKMELPIALGKTINGDVYITDLSKMPHLLIAGSTGSGKSVGINMIISSMLYSKHPSEVKLIMIDPKKIELSFYNKLRRHYLAVSPDLDEEIITVPQNAVLLLKSVEYEMETRYDKLAKAGVRNIVDYNLKVADPARRPKDTEQMKHHLMPYLVVIVDELADLMITAGKEVEEPITRLAQLARAVGIHLVLATQRPSVNVITGVIKANFSARIAYQVATKIDSRTILDMNGAETLLGRGDMLFLPTGSPKPIRIQNAFISTDEVETLTDYIKAQPGYSKPYFLPSLYDKKKNTAGNFLSDMDPMFEDAARVIVRHQQGSVSLLQRKLKLGYSRAARIVDQLEEAGIVGPNDGSKARTVIVESEEQLETIIRNL